MSRPVETWSKTPREAAHVWSGRGMTTYDQFVAVDLLVYLDCGAGPVPGDLEAAIERGMKGRINGHERQNYKRAIARMRARGLLFEHEGQIYLLYSETVWRQFRTLAEQYAEKKPVLTLVRKPAARGVAVAAEPTRSQREVDAQWCSENELTSRNHSTQGPRERERETLRANTACSAVPPPTAAPPPATPDPVTEVRPKIPEAKPGPAKVKRTRAPQPLDAPRDRAVELFNEIWSPTRGQGTKWAPRGPEFGLLTAMVQCYLAPDGTLNEPTYRLAVRAFVTDASWQRFGGWKPQKFLLHHLGGLTRMRPTGTAGGNHANHH
jgi:hypothetical protein